MSFAPIQQEVDEWISQFEEGYFPPLPMLARLTEEVGELARALRTGDRANLLHEFGDVLAWLTSLANLEEVDLDEAAARYAHGCPRCGKLPCGCEPR